MAAVHEPDQLRVGERLDEVNPITVAQDPVHRLAHVGVQVDGVDHLHVVEALHHVQQGVTNVLEGLAEALPPVTGDQHRLARRVEEAECLQERLISSSLDQLQAGEERVDDRIAHLPDVRLEPLPLQVLRRGLGGGEVQIRQAPGQLAVHLLRVG